MKIRAEFCFFHRKRVFLNRISKVDFNRVGSDHIAISRVAQAARRAPARDVHRQGAGRKHCFFGVAQTRRRCAARPAACGGRRRTGGCGRDRPLRLRGAPCRPARAGVPARRLRGVAPRPQRDDRLRLRGLRNPQRPILPRFRPGRRLPLRGRSPRSCPIPSRACRPRPK